MKINCLQSHGCDSSVASITVVNFKAYAYNSSCIHESLACLSNLIMFYYCFKVWDLLLFSVQTLWQFSPGRGQVHSIEWYQWWLLTFHISRMTLTCLSLKNLSWEDLQLSIAIITSCLGQASRIEPGSSCWSTRDFSDIARCKQCKPHTSNHATSDKYAVCNWFKDRIDLSLHINRILPSNNSQKAAEWKKPTSI